MIIVTPLLLWISFILKLKLQFSTARAPIRWRWICDKETWDRQGSQGILLFQVTLGWQWTIGTWFWFSGKCNESCRSIFHMYVIIREALWCTLCLVCETLCSFRLLLFLQVSDINPLGGIKTAMKRIPPGWDTAWIPTERLSLNEALKGYATLNHLIL